MQSAQSSEATVVQFWCSFKIIKSRSRDLCAFMCYLFFGALQILAIIINDFLRVMLLLKKVKMCFLAPVSQDNCERSKKLSLIPSQKDLDEGENLIDILSFCLSAKPCPHTYVCPTICIAASGLKSSASGHLQTKTETQSATGCCVACFLQTERKGH